MPDIVEHRIEDPVLAAIARLDAQDGSAVEVAERAAPDQVGSAGEGAPPSARDRVRRFPPPLNGTEQRLDALLALGDELLHELRSARLDAAGLDEVKENDPVLELTEPAAPIEVPLTEPAQPEPAQVELTEPAPGPKPAARPARKRAAKKAAPGR